MLAGYRVKLEKALAVQPEQQHASALRLLAEVLHYAEVGNSETITLSSVHGEAGQDTTTIYLACAYARLAGVIMVFQGTYGGLTMRLRMDIAVLPWHLWSAIATTLFNDVVPGRTMTFTVPEDIDGSLAVVQTAVSRMPSMRGIMRRTDEPHTWEFTCVMCIARYNKGHNNARAYRDRLKQQLLESMQSTEDQEVIGAIQQLALGGSAFETVEEALAKREM